MSALKSQHLTPVSSERWCRATDLQTVPSSLDPHRSILPPADPVLARPSRSIAQISLGEHRANRLRDYAVTSHREDDLAKMSRWDFAALLDKARLAWTRAKAEQIRADINLSRRATEVEEVATSNRWGTKL